MDANSNPSAMHAQLHGFESLLKAADMEIKEIDYSHNNFLYKIDSQINMMPRNTELNGDFSGDNHTGLQASHSTRLPPPRMWKKISHDISPSESLMLNITPGKRNREGNEEPQPNKKNPICQGSWL